VARILVVEDSAVDRHLVGALLAKQQHWQVNFAKNGLEALDYIQASAEENPTIPHLTKKGLPDVIVTDLRMPEMDGLELVRRIRQDFSRIPVVLITSYGSEQIAMDALRAGATNFSPKDSLRSDLVRTVSQVLSLTEHMKFERNPVIHPSAKQIAFVLENETSFIGPTIEHFQENLPAWSDRDRLQIGMALDEAISNAMHHGNLEVDSCIRDDDNEDEYYKIIRQRKTQAPFCHRRVRIEAEFSDQHICVQITDDGPGFDPSKIPDPTAEENLHRACGRGLFLIKSFMDTVSHNKTGNQITMTKMRRDDS
jgi:CheY-like chemotaxis protein/anti-sigma regulatory factor (Ser/Thr protein kinase)